MPVFEPKTYPVASHRASHWAMMTWSVKRRLKWKIWLPSIKIVPFQNQNQNLNIQNIQIFKIVCLSFNICFLVLLCQLCASSLGNWISNIQSIFECWSSKGGHLFRTPFKSYISVSFYTLQLQVYASVWFDPPITSKLLCW